MSEVEKKLINFFDQGHLVREKVKVNPEAKFADERLGEGGNENRYKKENMSCL